MASIAGLAALLGALLAGCGGAGGRGPAALAAPGATAAASIRRVVDGDTVVVDVGGHAEKVRLLGIDTPESVKPGTPVQCFAKAASARTAALLPRGTPVRLERDVEGRDRYGRLLAYVYRQQDGLFVNLELARSGYARQLTIPPNVAHVEQLGDAVRAARAASRGLWGACPAAASLPP